jgi:Secretion system C-terminal sorting domain
MKTKLLLKIIFLTFLVQKTFSQTYIPMLNNSSWNVKISSQTGPEYRWIEQGTDVVIGSFTYKKFIDFNTEEIYVREDIITKRVYRRINNSDVLMCDFSLQVGNTIALGNGYLYSVFSISNINVNGGQRRKFTLTSQSNPFLSTESWIEGVGNEHHPIRPIFELPTDPVYNVYCSYQNNVSVFNFGLASGGTSTTCPTPTLSIENQNLTEQKIKIYPNPFKTEITLKSEFNLENVSLELFNSIGQKVKEIENINTNEIILKRENLINGIYLLVLKQNKKIIETKKVIIEN